MAQADGTITLRTKVDTTGIKSGANQIKSGLSDVGAMLGKIGAAVGIAFGVSALVNFGKQAISLASDLQEVQNVVDVAFGKMSYKMEQFANTAIETYGISKLTAKKTGSSYMAMADGMGIAEETASDMALSLTGLSADMASFYNVSQDEAKTALSSVFTGETETLKRYGLLITEVNLQEYARQQGITKSINAMTQQEKVTLRYNYVLQATANAQGDFARTSLSWANQTRVLTERWNEMKLSFGEAFMTIGTLILPAINTLIRGLSAVANIAKQAAVNIAALFGKKIDISSSNAASNTAAISGSLGSAAGSAGKTAAGISNVGKAAKKTNKEIDKTVASFDELQILSSSAADSADSSGTGVDGGIGALGNTGGVAAISATDTDEIYDDTKLTAFVESFKTAFEQIKQLYEENFKPIFKNMWKNIQPEIQEFQTNLQGIWGDLSTLSQPLSDLFKNYTIPNWQTQLSVLGSILVGYFDSFNTAVKDLWDIAVFPMLQKFITTGLPIISDFGTKIVETLGVAFQEVKKTFDLIWADGAPPALQNISKIWCDIWTSMKEFWDTYGAPIFEQINIAVKGIGDILRTTWNEFLKPVWDNFMQNVDWLWTEHLKPLWDNVLDFVGSAIENILSLWNKTLAPLINWLISFLAPHVTNVVNTISDIATTIFAIICDIVSGILKSISGVIEFLTGVFTLDWKKAWDGITKAFSGTINTWGGLLKGALNVIIDLINGLTGGWSATMQGMSNIPGFGWAVNLKIPKIPKLAAGAVLPPNKPFMAVVGDQTSGTNIEAPLDTIKQALREVARENGTAGNTPVIIEIDGRELGRAVLTYGGREGRRTGGKLVFG